MGRILAFCVFIVLASCERPFVEVDQPDVVIVSPDLSVVLQKSDFNLTVRAGSFRSISSVLVNGEVMEFSESDRTWSLGLSVPRGFNALIIEASDSEGTTSIDTAYALHLPSQFIANGPPLPSGRGGHTTTRALNQDILVIGGASRAGGDAHSTMYVLPRNGSNFTGSPAGLLQARTGHTATVLADGKVLILGGSRSDNVSSVTDLVETPEVYDPETGLFKHWSVVGQPIRRTLHTAVYRRVGGTQYVDLHGGLGDTRYGSDPFLGVRPDLRTFRIEGEVLHAENNLLSAPYPGDAIYGHTITRVLSGPYLVFGGRFESNFTEESSFGLEFDTPSGLRILDAPPLHVPRTRHATASLFGSSSGQGSLLLVTGGRQYAASSVISETELYSWDLKTAFKTGKQLPVYPRYGHTTTITSSGQVLIIGGFSRDGTARTASEYFVVLP